MPPVDTEKEAVQRQRVESYEGEVMTPEEYLAAITALGLNLSSAARFLLINQRTSRRYASGALVVPELMAMLLRAMVRCRLTPEAVADLGLTALRAKELPK